MSVTFYVRMVLRTIYMKIARYLNVALHTNGFTNNIHEDFSAYEYEFIIQGIYERMQKLFAI